MHEKVRVSVHKSRGMMACSPNNAILGVEFDCPGLRRFWIMVRDGNRVELSVNALICDDRDCEDLSAVMQRVAAKGNQTDLAVCLQELLANKSTFVLASFMNTFV
jgi:hypothetical protein